MHLTRIAAFRSIRHVAAAVASATLFVASPVPINGATDFGGYRPHYQGPGVETPGGRGGTIYKVTNLNDGGPGSLRAALVPATCSPRFVIFEVSGSIMLASRIEIRCPYLTVAGQTAPSPGIQVVGHTIQILTHNVVLQHLQIRRGDGISTKIETTVRTGLEGGTVNVVFDHLSLAWGTDETVAYDAVGGSPPEPTDVTILDSIISETLDNPIDGQPNHSRAILFMPNWISTGTASIQRSLIAHNDTRNPSVRAGWRVALVNNVVYNYRGRVGGAHHGGTTYSCFTGETRSLEAAHVGNLAIPGPDTPANHLTIKMTGGNICPGSRLFLEGNQGYGISGPTGDGQWSGVYLDNTPTSVRVNQRPAWYTALDIRELATSNVEHYVLANAGARPLDRDSVDRRIVQEVRDRRGRIISTLGDVGGYPVLAQNQRTLTVPANPHDVVDAAGRTRIEAWLEGFARALESDVDTVKPPSNLRITPIQN